MKNIQVRVEDDLKAAADSIFEQIGTTTNDAIKMFLRASVREKGFPFELKLPKPQTLKEYVQSKMLTISDSTFREALKYRTLSGKYWKNDEFEGVFTDVLTIHGFEAEGDQDLDLANVTLFIVDPLRADFLDAADAESGDLEWVAASMQPLLDDSTPEDGYIAIIDEFFLFAPTATAKDRVQLLDDVFRYLNDRQVRYVGFSKAGLWRAESSDEQVALNKALKDAGYVVFDKAERWNNDVYALELPSVDELKSLN